MHMGMESFYINLTLNNDYLYDFSNLMIISSDIVDNKITITISYSLFSFFDGLSLAYSFIKKYESNILSVESKKEDLKQSTDNFLCFFDKMYCIWENKINNFRLEYGYFLINPNDDFFKSYKKLKKYIKH